MRFYPQPRVLHLSFSFHEQSSTLNSGDDDLVTYGFFMDFGIKAMEGADLLMLKQVKKQVEVPALQGDEAIGAEHG